MNGIIFVQFPVFNIIPNRTCCSGLDFKDKRISVFIYVSAIDLRSEEKITVDYTVTIVI